MARQGVRKSATKTYTIGTWSTLDGMLELGGDNAQATSIGQVAWALRFGDFSEIPQNVSIKGILIYLVAKKTENPGVDEGNLLFGVELTWAGITGGGAASYTSTGRKTPLLTDGWLAYEVGEREEATPWGRTWSRSELDDDSFQIRIATSSKGAVLGSPTWNLDYVAAVIFYDDDDSVEPSLTDTVTISETVEVSRMSAARGELVHIREDISPSGTAITPIKSDPTFATSAERSRRKLRFGCRLELGITGPTFFIGDAALATESGLTYPASSMQPGLVEVGEISAEGDFGADRRVSSVEVSFLNRGYINQSGAATVPATIPEWAQGEPLLGRTLHIWAFVESGDGWQQRLLFEGQVEDLDFTRELVTVRALRLGTGAVPVPALFVDSNLFDYYPGSAVEGTGEEVQSNRGKPVPFGIGRFDYTAVKLTADFETGHPFKVNDESGTPTEDEKTMTMQALFPAMFGKKFPMMPLIHAAKKWRRPATDNYLTHADMNVLLYGSRAASPELRVHCGPDPGHTITNRFPGVDTILATRSKYHNNDYFLLWGWSSGGGLSVGTPFFKCLSRYWITQGTAEYVPEVIYKESGVGHMDALHYGKWSDGKALDAFGVYVSSTFRRQDELPQVKVFPGPQQVFPVPMVGPTVIPNRVRHFPSRFAPVVPFYWNNSGSDDYSKAMNLGDLETKTRVAASGVTPGTLSLQAALTAPGSGTMRGVRLCALWNTATYTATALYFAIRTGHETGYQIWANWETFSYWKDEPESDEYNRDHNSEYKDDVFYAPPFDGYGGRIAVIKATNLAKGFASVWAYAPFDPHLGKPHEIVNGASSVPEQHNPPEGVEPYRGRPLPNFTGTPGNQPEIHYPGYVHTLNGAWDFTSYDIAIGGTTPLAYPMDCLIVTTGGYVDIYAMWMEVVFDASFQSDTRGISRASSRYVPGPPSGRGWDLPGHSEPYTIRFNDLPPEEKTLDGIFITGKGALDDAGDITGTAGRIIENPADVGATLIKHFVGELAFSTRAQSTDFGSFVTARTLLGATTWRMTLTVQEGPDLMAVLRRVGAQSKSFFAEQLDDNGDRVWRMFVDDPDPATNDTARLYRGTGYGFRWNHIAPGTFTARTGLFQELSSSFLLRYGWHIPSGTWAGEVYCTPSATNFATEAQTYMDALAETSRIYSNLLPVEFEAPDIWDPAVAEMLCKWRVNRGRFRRVPVEFDTYAGAMDLQEGHVITFDDEIGDAEKWPGLGSTSWSAHQFNVIQVSTRSDQGQNALVHVVAVEVYAEP